MLLSDGIPNAGGGTERLRQSLARAKAMSAPVFARPLGGQAGVRDLEVGLDLPQELAFVGQQVPVVVTLRQRGDLARQTRLSLHLAGKELESRMAKLIPDGAREEVFQVSQKTPGLYRYEIAADPLRGEVTTLNNKAGLLLRVVDQPIRVLLLEGKPYWDTKFLVAHLSSRRRRGIDQRGAACRGAVPAAEDHPAGRPRQAGCRRQGRPVDHRERRRHECWATRKRWHPTRSSSSATTRRSSSTTRP